MKPQDITMDDLTPKEGIHIGVPFPTYRAWKAINWHTLWTLHKQSPADALFEMQNGSGETAAKAFGSLTDFVLLEPGRFEAEAVVEPEIGEGKAPKRPTSRQLNAKNPSPESIRAIEFWQQWDEQNAGKVVVTRADYDKVLEIQKMIRVAQCRDLICGGRSQVCIVWIDPVTGLLCKARLDYERQAGWNHCITDLKTSRSAHPLFWQWAIEQYGYFGQLAWYDEGWRQVTGESSLCGWLIAQTQGCPQVVYYDMDDADERTKEAGRLVYRAALNRWAKCVKENDWPGYPSRSIGLSDFALRRFGVGPERIILPPTESPVREDTRTFEQIYSLEEEGA